MAKDLFLETMSKLREYRLNEELTEEEAVETLQAIDDMVDKTLADAGVPEEVDGEEAVETEVPEEAENTSFDGEETEGEESPVDDVELESKEMTEEKCPECNKEKCECESKNLNESSEDLDSLLAEILDLNEKAIKYQNIDPEDTELFEKGLAFGDECYNKLCELVNTIGSGDADELQMFLDEEPSLNELKAHLGLKTESKELEEGSKDLLKAVKSIRAKRGVEESISEIMKKSEVKQAKDLQLEEKSFNKFLTKFVTENYKNTKSMSVKNARLNKDALKLECEVKFKSGNTKMVEMKLEGIIRAGKPSVLRAKDNGFFKVESKSAPFKFGVVLKEGTLHCNSLSYKFETRINESKKAEVKGRLVIKESVKK